MSLAFIFFSLLPPFAHYRGFPHYCILLHPERLFICLFFPFFFFSLLFPLRNLEITPLKVSSTYAVLILSLLILIVQMAHLSAFASHQPIKSFFTFKQLQQVKEPDNSNQSTVHAQFKTQITLLCA